jgi:hypothetical protein
MSSASLRITSNVAGDVLETGPMDQLRGPSITYHLPLSASLSPSHAERQLSGDLHYFPGR